MERVTVDFYSFFDFPETFVENVHSNFVAWCMGLSALFLYDFVGLPFSAQSFGSHVTMPTSYCIDFYDHTDTQE